MKRSHIVASLLATAAFGVCGATYVAAQGQGQGQPAIVIQGATLIDGNGGAPVANSVIVIQGNRIAAVGRAGQVQVPAGAKIIDGQGKFVVPGLMDAKSNYYGYYGEAYLIWGVTSAFNSGGAGDVGQAERDAINHGIYAGPRLFNAVHEIRGPGADLKKTDDPVAQRNDFTPHTPDEARQFSKNFLSEGAAMVEFGDGDGPPEIFAASIDEGHKAGKPAVFRAVGPQVRAREAAAMGADVLIHTGEAGVELAKDPAKWKDYIDLPPDPYCDMDPAKEPDLIKFLIDHHTALEPDLMATDRGFHKNWARVQNEDAHFFDDPALASYYPPLRARNIIENVKSPETYLPPDKVALRACGFKNHVKFLHDFVAAGGHIVAASDIPQSPPGLGLQQEMTAYVEDVGLTPMQAIQAGTKWVAEHMKVLDQLGTVENGKLADLVIVDADPSKDIMNLRKIDTVIKDGKIVDRTYHYWFRNIFGAAGAFGNPVIEPGSERWAASLKMAAGGGRGPATPVPSPESSPTPGIESIMPYTLIRGTGDTAMTVKGFNFVKGSVVYIDNQPMETKVVSRNEIQAMVDRNTLSQAGRFDVVVKNPAPITTPEWGDTSNKANLLVPFEFTTDYSHNKW